MVNDQGGVNGRKINFISYDDGYSPPKTVDRPANSSRRTKSCSMPGRSARQPTARSGIT